MDYCTEARFTEHLKRDSRRVTLLTSINLFCFRKRILLELFLIKYSILPASPFHLTVLRTWPDSPSQKRWAVQCPHLYLHEHLCLDSCISCIPPLHSASSLFHEFSSLFLLSIKTENIDFFYFFVPCQILQA